MNFTHLLRHFRDKFLHYTPLVEVHISREAILHNYNLFQKKTGIEIAPVLKSNAYGHGLYEVASIMEKTTAPFLIVDSLYEAIFLRRKGIKKPLLVIGYTMPENIVHCRVKNVIFTITDKEQLKSIAQHAKRATRIHLKIDTGMHRQGILPYEIESVCAMITDHKYLHLEGVCSHFADADNENDAYTHMQKETWHEVCEKIEASFPHLLYKHLSATSGATKITKEDGNIVRLGIGLYGIDPSRILSNELKPVLSLYAPITSIKTVLKGEKIGYNGTYIAQCDMRIAILPLGYFEGIDRRLSNGGEVYRGDISCPIIGLVSMNMTIIDISHIPDARIGDKVLVLGGERSFTCSIESSAKRAHTIPYELLVHIAQHLRRIII